MATTTKTYKMYIGGEWVGLARRAAPGRSSDPPTASVIAEVPERHRGRTSDRAVEAAKKAYDEVWFDATPKERMRRCCKLADRDRGRTPRSSAGSRRENVGKPISRHDVGGDPRHRGQPPLLRRRCSAPRGQVAAGEYMKGFTSMIRREPIGVDRG